MLMFIGLRCVMYLLGFDLIASMDSLAMQKSYRLANYW